MVNGDVIDRILQLGDDRGVACGRVLAGTGTRTC